MKPDMMNAFCDAYGRFLSDRVLDFAWWLLLAATILAVIGGLVALVERLVMLTKGQAASHSDLKELTGGLDSSIIQALSGLVDSLVKAPVWFAIFLAALGLLWTVPTTMSAACTPPSVHAK